jgi:hypothetical protein
LCQTLTGHPGYVQGATAAQQATLRALGAIEPTPAGVYICRFDGGKICSFRDGTLLHSYTLAHEMILDHLSSRAQLANRSMSELFGHLFSRCVFLSFL